MMNFFYKNFNLFIFYILFLFIYLILNTGIHGDEYPSIFLVDWPVGFITFPSADNPANLFHFTNYALFFWIFPVFKLLNLFLIDFFKIIIHFVCFYFVYKFINLYLSKNRSILFAFIFIIFPTHDSINYSYTYIGYMLFTPSLLMFSFYLFIKNQIILGFFLNLVGSLTYSSPPFGIGLSFFFLIKKDFKKFILFVVPSVIYILTYLSISYFWPDHDRRIDNDINFISFFKNAVILFLSFLDSNFGPSIFLKIYYSILEIKFINLIIAFITIFFIYLSLKKEKISSLSNPLLASFIAIILLSICMFALTGMYYHSAFNLGNRVLIYSCLFITYLIFSIRNLNIFLPIILVLIISIFGLSDHWKKWNKTQIQIIENITNEKKILNLKKNDILIFKGYSYSKLGDFSHIDFISFPLVLNSILYNTFERRNNNITLMSYLDLNIDKKTIIDPKFKLKYYLNSNIYLYDLEKNLIEEININNVNEEIKKMKKERRHWLQTLNNKYVNYILKKFSPRLNLYF